ncbi:unnamed protein product, partial [Heterosigma akashiwo]
RPPALDEGICQQVLLAFNKVCETDAFRPFMESVTDRVAPGYSLVVPCPMYFNLVRRRLQNGYYRQIEAVYSDID